MNEQPAKKRYSILSFLKNLWRRFPSACTLCILLFLFSCIMQLGWLLTLSDGELNAWPVYLLPVLFPGILFGALGSLLLRRFRWPAWIHWLTALAGCLLGYFFRDHVTIYLGMVIAAALTCVHFALGTEHREKRFGQIAGAFLSSAGLTLCLTLLLNLCISALTTLLFRDSSFWKLESFLFSFSSCFSLTIVAPFLFLGRLPDDDTPPEKRGAFRKFTAYMLLPAFLLLTGILLVYIITILIKWEMPVGQMNWFALAALSFFTLLRLTLSGEEEVISRWFCRWGALLLVPVIIAQQVGVWIRIGAYGLTPARYIGLMITFLLIAVVVFSYFKEAARWFFAAAAILALLLTVTPLNGENVSRWSQEARLKTALNQSGMLKEGGTIVPNPDAVIEQKRIILSSADYLVYRVDDPPEGSFTEKLQAQFPSDYSERYELVFGFGPDSVTEKNREEKTVRGLWDRDSVDVAGFSHAQWYDFTYRYETMSPSDDNAKAFFVPEDAMACVDWDTKTLLRSDIPLENGKVFRISQLRLVSYDGEPDRLYVKGWLLTP